MAGPPARPAGRLDAPRLSASPLPRCLFRSCSYSRFHAGTELLRSKQSREAHAIFDQAIGLAPAVAERCAGGHGRGPGGWRQGGSRARVPCMHALHAWPAPGSPPVAPAMALCSVPTVAVDATARFPTPSLSQLPLAWRGGDGSAKRKRGGAGAESTGINRWKHEHAPVPPGPHVHTATPTTPGWAPARRPCAPTCAATHPRPIALCGARCCPSCRTSQSPWRCPTARRTCGTRATCSALPASSA